MLFSELEGKAMDRRIQKSRQIIMDTLIELLGEKDFEKITFGEIAERANVNRGTLYLHFTDKYDLLDKCIQHSLSMLEGSCDANPTESLENILVVTFEYMEQHATLYRTLLTQNGVPTFHNRMIKMMLARFDEQLDMSKCNANSQKNVFVQFIVSGLVGTIEWWFMSGMPCSAREISTQLLRLLEVNGGLPVN
jgi:AcrR family transcriptional regulator